MSKIDNISNVLDPFFKPEGLTKLEEGQAGMKVELISDGQKFLTLRFDGNLPRKDFPKGMFPFFNRGEPKVTKLCDYILFTEKDRILFVLLIELKKGHDNVTDQLQAGKCFVDYVISTVNRVFETHIEPEIRYISIRKRHIKPKPKQKQKDVEYDQNNFHTFGSNKFWLKSYLK